MNLLADFNINKLISIIIILIIIYKFIPEMTNKDVIMFFIFTIIGYDITKNLIMSIIIASILLYVSIFLIQKDKLAN